MILVFDRYAYIMPLFLFQEESEVPDDETVNQMLARSEEEFELYQVFAQIIFFFMMILLGRPYGVLQQLKEKEHPIFQFL